MELQNNSRPARGIEEAASESLHRSVYLPLVRSLTPTSLQVFDFVHVTTEAPEGQQPTEIPTLVTVTESAPRRLEFGVGYGSEDKVRGSVDWHHFNLGGAGQHFKASGKWSSTLSGMSVGYQIPYPFRTMTSADTQVYAWWTDIPTYTSQSNGGTIDAVYRISPIGARRREAPDGLGARDVGDEMLRLDDLAALDPEAHGQLRGHHDTGRRAAVDDRHEADGACVGVGHVDPEPRRVAGRGRIPVAGAACFGLDDEAVDPAIRWEFACEEPPLTLAAELLDFECGVSFAGVRPRERDQQTGVLGEEDDPWSLWARVLQALRAINEHIREVVCIRRQ